MQTKSRALPLGRTTATFGWWAGMEESEQEEALCAWLREHGGLAGITDPVRASQVRAWVREDDGCPVCGGDHADGTRVGSIY